MDFVTQNPLKRCYALNTIPKEHEAPNLNNNHPSKRLCYCSYNNHVDHLDKKQTNNDAPLVVRPLRWLPPQQSTVHTPMIDVRVREVPAAPVVEKAQPKPKFTLRMEDLALPGMRGKIKNNVVKKAHPKPKFTLRMEDLALPGMRGNGKTNMVRKAQPNLDLNLSLVPVSTVPAPEPEPEPEVRFHSFEELGNYVETYLGGTNFKMIIQKVLTSTDTNPSQARLTMPELSIRENFLTPTEKGVLFPVNEEKGGKKNYQNVTVMGMMSTKQYRLNLTKWNQSDTRKLNGETVMKNGPIPYAFVINGGNKEDGRWNTFKTDNKLHKGDEIQVWSFRIQEELGFAVIKV